MVIMGLSGFETSRAATNHLDRQQAAGNGDLPGRAVDLPPLQFFPLQLIGHDPAAALLVDGQLVACAAEERFTRIKHGYNLAGSTVLPRRAMNWCLERAGLGWNDVDGWAHYCRFTRAGVEARRRRIAKGLPPELQQRLAREYERTFATRLSREVIRGQIETITGRQIDDSELVQVPHHLAHLAGAFYSSGFSEAACLAVDGYGEEESSLWALGEGTSIKPDGSILLPSSLGVLYQLLSRYLGFRAFGDEYKVMGLAAYGDPRAYSRTFEELVELLPDGHYSTASMSRPDLEDWLTDAFGTLPDDGEYAGKRADIAAGLQRTLERTMLHTVSHLRERYGVDRLCLSGGVALNARANGVIVASRIFKRVFIQPAAADEGASLGAALHDWHQRAGAVPPASATGVFWGPDYRPERIEKALRDARGLSWTRADDVEGVTARLLADRKLVGWFQGRMEMGPRALGARSILASPHSAALRERLNTLVKHREPFRPFAPSVVEERATQYFVVPDLTSARFMTVTYPSRESVRNRIAGVVHVDGSSRIQTVAAAENPRFHKTITAFGELTGVPLVLNTSFNQAGEPIVASPEDAVRCFLRSGLDALVIGDYVAFPEMDEHAETM